MIKYIIVKKLSFEEKRIARYTKINFQHNKLTEKLIKKILNALPKIESVRGGGKKKNNKELVTNQISVGKRVYANVNKNSLNFRDE